MSDSGDAENPIAGKEEGKEPDRPMSLLEQKRSMRAIDHPPEIDRNPIKLCGSLLAPPDTRSEDLTPHVATSSARSAVI